MTDESAIRARRADESAIRSVEHSLRQGLRAGERSPSLLGADGTVIVLPESLLRLLHQVAEILARGDAVSIVPINKELTTQQAADILNVSRPHLISLLDKGKIEYSRTGKHRRIQFDNLIAYKRERDRDRRLKLAELTRMSEDFGSYEQARAIPSLSAVLDACVLYPFNLRDTLLRMAEKGLYRVHWSAQIIEEARRNLVANAKMSEDASRRLMAKLWEAFPEANVVGYEPLIRHITNDEKDRHVVAAAVRCRARTIVTTNLKDFPAASLSPYGLEAEHPDQFLCKVFDLDPDRVVLAVNEQAGDLRRPPRSVTELLEMLAKVVPEFAKLVLGSL